MADTSFGKGHLFEREAASGTVCLTLDKQVILWQKFNRHVSISITFDNVLGSGEKNYSEVLPTFYDVCKEETGRPNLLTGPQPGNSSPGDPARAQDSDFSDATVDVVLPVQFNQASSEQSGWNHSEGTATVETSKSVSLANTGLGNSDPLSVRVFQQKDSHSNAAVTELDKTESVEDNDTEKTTKEGNMSRSKPKFRERRDSPCSESQLRVRKIKMMRAKTRDTIVTRTHSNQKRKTRSERRNISHKFKRTKNTIEESNLGSSPEDKDGTVNSGTVSEKETNVKTQLEVKKTGMKRKSVSGVKKVKTKKLSLEKDVKCDYCHRMFKSQQEYFDHRKSNRSDFKCKICGKVVSFRAHLMVHMRKHNRSMADELVFPEGSANLLQANISGVDSTVTEDCELDGSKTTKGVKCDICGLILSNIPILKTHTMTHTGEVAYKCCVCGLETYSIARYNNHLSTHMKAGRVQCKICNISFQSRGELSKHQLTHELKCNLCGNVFPNKTSRAFHYKMAHTEDILKCKTCGKLYSSEEELKSHLKYHRNRSKTQCPICGLFVSRLDNHMFSHNQRLEESKVYVCDKCQKEFRQKLSFQRHLKTHSEEKPYACMECSKRFARSGGLRRHMITHTQEKPFVCEICGKACSQMGNLKIHMQIHKPSGPVHCSVCGQSFSCKSMVQEHMRTAHYVDVGVISAPAANSFALPPPPIPALPQIVSSVSQVYYS